MERPTDHNFASKFNVLPVIREFINSERDKTFNQIISENLLKETPEEDIYQLLGGTKFRQVKDGKFRGGVTCGEIMVKRVLNEKGDWLTSQDGKENKYMALDEFEYWFIKKGNKEKEYRLFNPGEIFSASKKMEKQKTPSILYEPKESLPKSKQYEEKKYYVSTINRRLRGTNQHTFEAHKVQIMINGKKRNVFIPEENITLYRNGYVTVRGGRPVIIKKLK